MAVAQYPRLSISLPMYAALLTIIIVSMLTYLSLLINFALALAVMAHTIGT